MGVSKDAQRRGRRIKSLPPPWPSSASRTSPAVALEIKSSDRQSADELSRCSQSGLKFFFWMGSCAYVAWDVGARLGSDRFSDTKRKGS
jgi:hypothetical protein